MSGLVFSLTPLSLLSPSHCPRDWQLAASSVVSRASDPDCAVKHARLHAPGKQAWCPEQGRENEWILVDLGVTSEVAGVMTQGRDKRGAQSWVTHYFISYSEDAYRWDWARDIYGIKKVQYNFEPCSSSIVLDFSSNYNCVFAVTASQQNIVQRLHKGFVNNNDFWHSESEQLRCKCRVGFEAGLV